MKTLEKKEEKKDMMRHRQISFLLPGPRRFFSIKQNENAHRFLLLRAPLLVVVVAMVTFVARCCPRVAPLLVCHLRRPTPLVIYGIVMCVSGHNQRAIARFDCQREEKMKKNTVRCDAEHTHARADTHQKIC